MLGLLESANDRASFRHVSLGLVGSQGHGLLEISLNCEALKSLHADPSDSHGWVR